MKFFLIIAALFLAFSLGILAGVRITEATHRAMDEQLQRNRAAWQLSEYRADRDPEARAPAAKAIKANVRRIGN